MIDRIISEKYKVIRELGRGGMGVIYEALHITLKRTVAIKILHPQFTGDPAFLSRLHREARAMARLNHDAILGVFDVAEDLGAHYIVMEYFQGKDLKQLMLEEGPLSQEIALSIALQVAKGLSYAHANGVIHRDIKPSNIMVNDAGEIKIADFGIAAATDEVAVTAAGHIIGTPEYMSVEQAQGEELDGRSDLYSLGMVIYELVTGKTTFVGISGVAILGKLLYEKKEFDFSFPDQLSSSLQDLIKNLLKKNRENRVADAASLIEKITRIQSELEIGSESSEPNRQPGIAETLLIDGDDTSETVMLPKPTSSEHSTEAEVPSLSLTVEDSANRPPILEATEKLETSRAKKSYPLAPQSKNKWLLYLSVAGISALILAGIFFNRTSSEKKALPPPRQEPSQIDEMRDIQRSIEAIEVKLRRSKKEANHPDVHRLAKEIYDKALALERRGSDHLKDADNFLEKNAFPAAKENFLTAKSLFIQADEGFLKAKETAALRIVQEEKTGLEQEKEKQQNAKTELERLRQERIQAERERERQEAIARVEGERLREEEDRAEKERLKQARLKAEREGLAQERIEAERNREKQEAIVRIEEEKLRQERDRAESKRLERERLAQERIQVEQEREKQEKIARIEAERLRQARDRAESKRLERERLDRERIQAEQEREKQEKIARIEAERLERERMAQERIRGEEERRRQEKIARIEREKILIARNKALRKISPPSSGDSVILGGILNRLKHAYENKDLAALQRMSQMPNDRAQFFSRLFKDYETINISVVDLSIIGHSAYAIVSITKLTSNKDAPVLPSKKMKDAKLSIHKEKGKWGKVIW